MYNAKRLFKTMGNVLLFVVLLLLAVLLVVSAISNLFGNGTMFGSYGIGLVMTGSMEPDIPTGSFILVQKSDINELRVGDVIMFHSDDPQVPQGVPVSHAIMEIRTDDNGNRIFTTKGTANEVSDPYPVLEADVIGRVIWHSTVLGSVVTFAQKPWVYPVLISILAFDLIFQAIHVFLQAQRLQEQESVTE